MIKITMLVSMLALLVAPAAMAQPSTPSLDQGGIIERIDEGSQVVILQGGRMYRVTPATAVYINNQPVSFSALRPGQTVIVRSGEPVVYQNGHYVVVSPGSSTVVAPGAAVATPGGAVATAPGGTVTTAPGSTVTTTPGSSTVVVTSPGSGMVKQTLYGQVSDVDSSEVQIKTDKGKLEVRMPPGMSNQIRKGDNVQIDLTYSPTSPSAFPRR
jgi:hypothetical protein